VREGDELGGAQRACLWLRNILVYILLFGTDILVQLLDKYVKEKKKKRKLNVNWLLIISIFFLHKE
jgi:hypothetical protein